MRYIDGKEWRDRRAKQDRDDLVMIHIAIGQAFSEIADVVKAARVERGPLNGWQTGWHIEITTPGREPFHWVGKAGTQAAARFEAWCHFLSKYRPDYIAECKAVSFEMYKRLFGYGSP